MPTPCWLKHLCSIRALVPVSFFLFLFLSILSLFLSLYLWLILWSVEAHWAHFLAWASKTLSRGHLVPTYSSASPGFQHKPGDISLFLSLTLRTTRFQSIKGPTSALSCLFSTLGKHFLLALHYLLTYFNLRVALAHPVARSYLNASNLFDLTT